MTEPFGMPIPTSLDAPDSENLTEMARIAWRNNARCIGRLFWQTLELLDARSAATPDEVFEGCVAHLRHSTHAGKIRPTVTVFQPAEPGERGIRIWNRQLIRYAGYRASDGTVLGDPEQVPLTEKVIEMGWQPPRDRGAFDVLPLVIECPGALPKLFVVPEDAVLEVPLTHPDLPWFADLRLKWHALPAVSDMALVGHGLRFTAAPFSGYYMGTEIASRNLGDESRYNLLPDIADRMGIDRSSRRMLWKDRALVELNTAVLHSFREAGVAIVDHHTASAQFMQHVAQEEKCGRSVPGDWSWLVPPMSGSACPVFHRYYDAARPEPSFVDQQRAW
ncbi:MAG: nitric oxide synthase oxygenase [Akkermansiaceae bacterium]|nr:nitric oxide synthase oxygenase [Akkermansiaceae bacterium]